MATVSYITPITDRTQRDVEYARTHQADLKNKNKGAWNYTDMNRVCNNLKYAAEYMYEQAFLPKPYTMQIKLDWKETDIITYEELNTMIINNMNNLKTYARPDISWYPIKSIINMDYSIANWLEKDIHALATQEPIPPDKYTLTVENGSGSGEYEANTVVTIKANEAPENMIFSHWSGDHLENIGSGSAANTTYTMPHQDIKLKANYTDAIPHDLKVVTYTKTETVSLSMGRIYQIEADPAPQGKVFHHWDVNPKEYEDGLYEPAASTHFTMPNAEVTITAIYITKGEKQLVVENGKGSGWYEFDTYASVSSNKPANGTFTRWTGDTQYLTGPVTQEYNSVKIPDVNVITIRANWSVPAAPPATNIKLTVNNGVIASTGATTGTFTQGDRVSIRANAVPSGSVFGGWSHSGGGEISGSGSTNATVIIGTSATTVTATYRTLEYHTLTVITNSGTTTTTKEKYEYFSVDANPIPSGYTFDKWTGDTHTFNQYSWNGFDTSSAKTGTYMGGSDRTITANYRPINPHTLTVKQLSGDVTYEQAEYTTVSITAEDAPAGKRFTGWSKSGSGSISSYSAKTITFTFGNGDTTLTPNYVNVWTITVEGGTINGSTSAVLDEGSEYRLQARGLAVYERFDGWSKYGSGSIRNPASTSTYYTVGHGDTRLVAEITKYPDKTLTVYWRHPETGVDTLVSRKTYTYGTKIANIEAHTAPDKTTFSTWLGDVNLLSPSALASTVTINSLTADTTIIATYFYPQAPEYYTLTVYDGYPDPPQDFAVGSQITVRAKTPAQGWEFHKWYGDIQFLVNPDLSLSENAVIMPAQAITLYAKFRVEGELPLYRISVENGTASATYVDLKGNEHNESGVYIDVPEGTEVKLLADPDTVGYTFDYWKGNFEQAGVTDIVKTNNPTYFTSTEHDLNITMMRRELAKFTVFTTNATGPGYTYVGKYPINGNLRDTDNYHYDFKKWICTDANGKDCISAIENPTKESTNITLSDRDLWIEATYTTTYKLTVVAGQDTGDGYYYKGERVTSITADTPKPDSNTQFDHWDDPMGVVENIYDPTPTIIMKDTVARITAVFVSIDAKGNSIAMTGADIHDELITRQDSYLINGVYTVGTIVFDKDGCIGTITKVDPDDNDNTNDYEVNKLFYGGNF